MGNSVSAVIGVDSVEEGLFPDRANLVDLRVENDNDLHLDCIKMSYRTIARHDRYRHNC